jgi:thiol-disulfide isomerase/thioredoxin
VKRLLLVWALVVVAVPSYGQLKPLLRIGDPAPKLSISKWHKGAPVNQFQPGKIYVVEMWATWCAPCIEAMPHLSSIQKKYAGKVQVIGVSVLEQQRGLVAAFVRKNSRKMAYTVAEDMAPKAGREGPTAIAWMKASMSTGIPRTFVIGRSGTIEWIGHPEALEPVLEKIVEAL